MKTSIVIVLSCVLGVLVGLATATSALTINAWNPELEYKKHADLIREAGEKNSDVNAKASIENTVFDFGIKDVKEKGSHDFFIKNVGTAPLTIEVNRTTCTCTGIDLSSKRLLPGQTAKATVRYDAERAQTGPYTQGGTIVTNDPSNREIMLSIKGIFTAPIVLSPTNLFFPSVPAGETRSANVRIYGFEKSPPLRTEAPEWTDRDHFELKLTPSELNDDDKKNSMYQHAVSVYDGEVTVKPGLPIGTFQEKFYFKTNYPSEPSVEFLARGQISGGAISISGMVFNKDTGSALLGQTNRGQALSRDVSIQFSGSAAHRAKLVIKDIKPAWLKATLTEPRDIGGETARRRIYTLTIEVPAQAPVANFMKSDEDNVAMISLETGLDESPTVKIPIQFAVVE